VAFQAQIAPRKLLAVKIQFSRTLKGSLMGDVVLQMEGIDKSFPGVHALNKAQFELRAGEVHALVGENGAGKSTLMKILAGIYAKDAGVILYQGKEAEIPNPRAAQHLGISMIHQELNLMPHLSLAQNVFVGREPRGALPFMLDEKKINAQTQALFDLMHLRLDPRTKAADLTVAKQQMVEIAKALSFNSQVLIMDEPTAALTESEIAELFRLIRQFRDKGRGHCLHLAPAGRTETDFRPHHRDARRPLCGHRGRRRCTDRPHYQHDGGAHDF
jgi:ribose transport system ATP-binding protein